MSSYIEWTILATTPYPGVTLVPFVLTLMLMDQLQRLERRITNKQSLALIIYMDIYKSTLSILSTHPSFPAAIPCIGLMIVIFDLRILQLMEYVTNLYFFILQWKLAILFTSFEIKNDIRDVGSTIDFVLVFLIHLLHWYLVHRYPLIPTRNIIVPDCT